MTFLENKYKNWYYRIIENGINREMPLMEYCENHHIIPRSLGGSDLRSNMVLYATGVPVRTIVEMHNLYWATNPTVLLKQLGIRPRTMVESVRLTKSKIKKV